MPQMPIEPTGIGWLDVLIMVYVVVSGGGLLGGGLKGWQMSKKSADHEDTIGVQATKITSLQNELAEFKADTKKEQERNRNYFKDVFDQVGAIAEENKKYREEQLQKKIKELEEQLKERKK
jgi:NTP pyrophosphatase (non-canonical NTP hydrolase)